MSEHDPVGTRLPDAASAAVVVIGAGPGGLAVAACLRQQGVTAQVLEKAQGVAASWRSHYSRLHLHTVKEHSGLPHLPFPADYPRYVSRQQMVDYLGSYARHFDIAPHLGEEVVSVARDGPVWQILCRSGRRIAARSVVVATGANRVPNEPEVPGQDNTRAGSATALPTDMPRPSAPSACWWWASATPAPRSHSTWQNTGWRPPSPRARR